MAVQTSQLPTASHSLAQLGTAWHSFPASVSSLDAVAVEAVASLEAVAAEAPVQLAKVDATDAVEASSAPVASVASVDLLSCKTNVSAP